MMKGREGFGVCVCVVLVVVVGGGGGGGTAPLIPKGSRRDATSLPYLSLPFPSSRGAGQERKGWGATGGGAGRERNRWK